jgi:hypothetical protein
LTTPSAQDGSMIMPAHKDGTCAELGDSCDAARDAYETAGRALDAALRREGGATASEWKTEYDTRIDLRLARAAYVAACLEFTAIAATAHQISRIGLDQPASKL